VLWDFNIIRFRGAVEVVPQGGARRLAAGFVKSSWELHCFLEKCAELR
jgi:hypothetical protein